MSPGTRPLDSWGACLANKLRFRILSVCVWIPNSPWFTSFALFSSASAQIIPNWRRAIGLVTKTGILITKIYLFQRPKSRLNGKINRVPFGPGRELARKEMKKNF